MKLELSCILDADAEAQVEQARETIKRFGQKVSAVLATFEDEGISGRETVEARVDAARQRLETFTRRVGADTAQYTLGLVKSHYPEVDLEPVGDGMPRNTSDEAWAACLEAVEAIAARVADDLRL